MAICEDEFRSFRVDVPEEDLADLRDRLDRVRWTPEPDPAGADYGMTVAVVRSLAEHWRDRYDWRAQEARINAYPQFTTTIDGTRVHFLHVRSPEPDALPLILSHGWPGSVAEYLDVLGPLTDPRAHGLDPSTAFDVVVPSLPGSGFSGPATGTGWGPQRIARAWAVLMRRLGYRRYGAAGNDWGSFISPELGRIAPEAVAGVHVTQAWVPPPADDPALIASLSAEDRRALDAFVDYQEHHAAYGTVQGQAPQTLAHALTDSPAGLLGWNAQAMQPYGLDPDAILTHVSIHWFTLTGGTAIRIYADAAREPAPAGPTTVPMGVAQFPGDLPSVRALAERAHAGIVSWNRYDRGGHYAAHTDSDLVVRELRQFFASIRH
jgi:pimeloyl-ACP methyl ester carboxylesterase